MNSVDLNRCYTAYRICERRGEDLLTLFHGVNGSRKLPINKWLTANIKQVTDGNRKTSTEYKSGFHTLLKLDECRDFTRKFRAPRDLVIVECQIKGRIWSKSHSRANVILAEHMKLIKVIEDVKMTQ